MTPLQKIQVDLVMSQAEIINVLTQRNKSLLEAAKKTLMFLEGFHYDEDRPEGSGEIEEILGTAIRYAEEAGK